MSNIDDTLKERGTRYGEFIDHSEITQSLKDALHSGAKWNYLDDDMKECLEMVAHKIGRIINGDPNYIDSWTDIIGYTRLVEKRLITDHATAEELMRGDLFRQAADNVSIGEAPAGVKRESPEKTDSLGPKPAFTAQEIQDLANFWRSLGYA